MFPILSTAQSSTDSIKAGWGVLNFAVPESPAFKILGVSPSDIMRPTTTRDIAVSVGNYFLTNGGAIPKDLAVEIAPSLFNPKLSLADYNANKWWYNSTISIGTKQNPDGSYAAAVGVSTKIIDKADLRSNSSMISFDDVIGPKINAAMTDETNAIAFEMFRQGIPYDTAFNRVSRALTDTSDKNYKVYHTKIDSCILAKGINANSISQYRDSLKNALWNATVLEIGFASLFNSQDSLIKNISSISQIGFWLTYGHRLGKKGQLLLGVNGNIRDTGAQKLNDYNINVGARIYYGGNDLKAFVDGEVISQSYSEPIYQSDLGIEGTFFGGLWASFSLGIKKVDNQSIVFTPALTLNLANGEKKSNSK